MHGLGNDFAVFDARKQPLALDGSAARAIADRRLGVGCDQVIVIEKAMNGADALMRIFNADGGEVESCGNATRCIAAFLMEDNGSSSISLETAGGSRLCTGGGDGLVTVDMGAPKLDWRDIPLAHETETQNFALDIPGSDFPPLQAASAANIGNPHCVIFVDDAERVPVPELGPLIEHHPLFPERTNAEFVQVMDRRHLRMRVWERGAGITLACGTGACAAAVAAHRRRLAERNVEVLLDGGVLSIAWRESDGHVLMTGPVALSYCGEIDLAGLA